MSITTSNFVDFFLGCTTNQNNTTAKRKFFFTNLKRHCLSVSLLNEAIASENIKITVEQYDHGTVKHVL